MRAAHNWEVSRGALHVVAVAWALLQFNTYLVSAVLTGDIRTRGAVRVPLPFVVICGAKVGGLM